MSVHHEISVYLSSSQFLKYRKGNTFQLTNAQLQADNGNHLVDVHLSKKDYKKLLTAIKNGKGYRFSNKNVVGGSLWGSFKKGLSAVGSFVKNNVNKEDVNKVLRQGVDMVAPDSVKEIAKRCVDKVVDYGYDESNKGKSLKEHALSLANDLQSELNDAGLQAGKQIVDKVKEKLQGMNPDDAVEGTGFKKFKKGSQAAKDHMARIRAMRKSKSVGGNIIKVERSVRDIVPMSIRPLKGSPEMKERMSSMKTCPGEQFNTCWYPKSGACGQYLAVPAGAMVGEELGNMGADTIGNLTGRGLRNNIHTPYGKYVKESPDPLFQTKPKKEYEKKVTTHDSVVKMDYTFSEAHSWNLDNKYNY